MITTKSRLLGIAVAGLTLGAAFAARAESKCAVDPLRQPFYRLELTVPATYCKGAGRDPGCKTFPKAAAIQLHGLWVDYGAGPGQAYPAGQCSEKGCETLDRQGTDFCRTLPDIPELYRAPAWTAKRGYFAATEKCLERHEWVKHGTCSPMAPAEWITWSLDRTEAIATRIGLPLDRPLSPAEADRLIRTNLPALDGTFALKCRDGFLLSLSIDYDWGPRPGPARKRPGGKNRYRGCDGDFVIPSRP